MTRPRILSGMRPTGPLHLGNLMGALENWVALQDRYECFFSIVDWHSLTTDYTDPSAVQENALEVATDWLAAGLDPRRSTLFVQSLVPLPPLDGSWIASWGLPRALAAQYDRVMEPYGQWILLILFASGLLWKVLRPFAQGLSTVLYRLAL